MSPATFRVDPRAEVEHHDTAEQHVQLGVLVFEAEADIQGLHQHENAKQL